MEDSLDFRGGVGNLLQVKWLVMVGFAMGESVIICVDYSG